MAKDISLKKRKASIPEVGTEKLKVKKVSTEIAEMPAKKRKAAEDASPVEIKKSKKVSKESTKDVKPISNPSENGDVGIKVKSGKKSKKTAEVEVKVVEEIVIEEPSGSDEEDLASASDDEDSEIEDQTEALLKGFESDGDEEDALNEEGLPEGQEVPTRKELSKKQEKALKKAAKASDSDKPGVIYIGRIPHGFYENEMRSYFKQFGNILKLRLSRNKKTGASKHHAWIQFESAVVADIVAKTMDNYLMFGHILKVKIVPDEQIPEDLFKGANKRFKKVPWNKMEGRKLAQGQSEKVWDERVEREKKRRDEKAAKLKEIGYEFESPSIKSTSDITRQEKTLPAPETPNTPLLIEAVPAATKISKAKKETETSATAELSHSVKNTEVIEKKAKKTKKGKKQKISA